MTYFTPRQHTELLGSINPNRVRRDGKGFSHVEAYEIRAHLNRVIGFARWSADLTDLALVFETSAMLRKKKDGKEYGDPYEAWTVLYRATVRLTVCAPDGTVLATYTEAATGEAQNQPSRGDAHDLAIKTAESQAIKRCAVNLGDGFGLSLYAKGSVQPLVRSTLVYSSGDHAAPSAAPVDAHITEPIPAESEQVEDKRETNPKAAEPQPTTPTIDARSVKEQFVLDLRERVLGRPADIQVAPWFARVQMEASKNGVMKLLVEDRDGNMVTVGAFLQQEQARARNAA